MMTESSLDIADTGQPLMQMPITMSYGSETAIALASYAHIRYMGRWRTNNVCASMQIECLEIIFDQATEIVRLYVRQCAFNDSPLHTHTTVLNPNLTKPIN